MNKQIEALKMAIEWKNSNKYTAEQVIETCKEALAEVDKQEWQSLSDDDVKAIEEVLGIDKVYICAIERTLKEKNG